MEMKKKNSPSLCNPSPQISMSAPFPTSVSLGRVTISRASSVVSARLATNWTEAVGTAQVRNHSRTRWGPRYPRGYHTRFGGKRRVRSGTDEVWGHKGKSRVRRLGLELGVPEGCFWGAVWLPDIFFPFWLSSELPFKGHALGSLVCSLYISSTLLTLFLPCFGYWPPGCLINAGCPAISCVCGGGWECEEVVRCLSICIWGPQSPSGVSLHFIRWGMLSCWTWTNWLAGVPGLSCFFLLVLGFCGCRGSQLRSFFVEPRSPGTPRKKHQKNYSHTSLFGTKKRLTDMASFFLSLSLYWRHRGGRSHPGGHEGFQTTGNISRQVSRSPRLSSPKPFVSFGGFLKHWK